MAGKSKEMELAIKIAGKIDKSFNSALSGASKAIRGMTKALAVGSVAAAAAVGVLATKAISVGKEFEASMSQVGATLRIDKATEEGAAQLAMLEEAARKCGRETKFSASEAAEGLNNLAMAGYDAEQAATALPTALKLAGAGNLEIADSARYLTAVTAALGLEKTSESFNHLSDVMALTAAKAKTDVSQIGEALTTLGGTGKGLKGGVNEISAALGILANADITGSEGGTHLRNMILSLQNPRNKNAAAMFEQLGVKAYTAKGQMRGLNEIFGDLNTAMAGMNDAERNAAIATIFKQTDLAAARAMLDGCGKEYDELYEAAVHASDGIGAAQEMYDRQTDNLQGDIDKLNSALADIGISAYENMAPALRGMVQFATEIASQFGEAFANGDLAGGITGAIDAVLGSLEKLPEGFRQAGAAAAALAAANLVSTVLDSKAWAAGVSGVKTFGQAVQMLPVTVPAAMGKARAAVLNFLPPGLVNRAGGVFTAIGGKAAGLASTIAQAGGKAWNNFAGDSLLGKIVGRVSAFAGRVGSAVGRVGGAILSVGGKLAGGLQSMMSIAIKAFMPAALIGALLVALGLLQSRFGTQIDGLLAMVREQGPQVISNFAAGIASRIPALLAQGAQLVANLLQTIGALAPSLVMGGAQILTALVNGVAQNAPLLISGAVSAVGGFASGILQALPMILLAGMRLLLGLVQGISQNLPAMAQGAVQSIQGFVQGFISALPQILMIAGQIIVTLVQGLGAALPALLSGAVQIIAMLAQGFISNLPMIVQTGVQVISAIAAGIISGIGTLIGMIPGVFGMVKDAVMTTDWLAVGSDIIGSIGEGIKGGAKSVWTNIKNAVTGGGEKVEAPQTPGAPAPAAPTVPMPSPASYGTAGIQGAAAYAAGFQSGAPQIGSAVQTAVGLSAAGLGTEPWTAAGEGGAAGFTGGIDRVLAGYTFDTSNIGVDPNAIVQILGPAGANGGQAFTSGLDASLSGYTFDTSNIGVDPNAIVQILGPAGANGGQAFTSGLDASLSGYTFDTSNIGVDPNAIVQILGPAGANGGQAFTSGLDASLSGYTFDPSSVGLDVSGFQSDLQTAASSGGNAFTSGLDSSLAGYQIDMSGIGIDSSALTASMTEAGTAGGQAFTDALNASLGSSSFDLATAANIDTGSISGVMGEAGTSGGQAFTSGLSGSLSAFSFNPASLGITSGVVTGFLRPVGTAGGQALTQALQGAISAGTGAVVGAAHRLGSGVASAISSGFSRAKHSASSSMSAIHSICASGAQRAASAVKHAFEHMHITIPRPRIPVVHVSTSTTTVGGQSVSVPRFSVSYHALGGIFNRATLLQSLAGGAHVLGESGPEAILPLDTLWTRMRQILTEILQGKGTTVDSLLQKLQTIGSRQQNPEPAGAGAGGGTVYFSPTYNLYGTATREDAERAGRATFEEFKKFMQKYERENRRKKF